MLVTEGRRGSCVRTCNSATAQDAASCAVAVGGRL